VDPFPNYDKVPACPNPPPKNNDAPCYPNAYGTCRKCVSYKCWEKSWRYRYCSEQGMRTGRAVCTVCERRFVLVWLSSWVCVMTFPAILSFVFVSCSLPVFSITSMTWVCQYNVNSTDNQYKCAFGFPGFGPLPLTCNTGICRYNEPPPPPPPPPPRMCLIDCVTCSAIVCVAWSVWLVTVVWHCGVWVWLLVGWLGYVCCACAAASAASAAAVCVPSSPPVPLSPSPVVSVCAHALACLAALLACCADVALVVFSCCFALFCFLA